MARRDRYPIGQSVYLQKTGRLLAHRVGQLFNQLGYATWICKGQNKGVDLKVYASSGDLVVVAEILNWSPRTNLSATRLNKIIRNLSAYNCNRALIYTTLGNEEVLDKLYLYGIDRIKIDYQILPSYFYRSFQVNNRILDRKIDSRATTLHVKTKLSEYTQTLNLPTIVIPAEKITVK